MISKPVKLSKDHRCVLLTGVRVDQQVHRKDLSKKAKISENTIANWELGKNNPFSNVDAWANSLGYTVTIEPITPIQKVTCKSLVKQLMDIVTLSGVSDYRMAIQCGYSGSVVRRFRQGLRRPSLAITEDILNECGYELMIVKKPTS